MSKTNTKKQQQKNYTKKYTEKTKNNQPHNFPNSSTSDQWFIMPQHKLQVSSEPCSVLLWWL